MLTLLSPTAPLWRLGFRSFFLGAALLAMLGMGLWLAVFFGILPPLGAMPPIAWHSHEMVYGFASAVIAGFVLTATQNWTGIRGVHGWRLQAIAALWVLARILLMAPQPWATAAALVDLAFYPTLALYLLPYLRDPEMKTERVFFLYFLLFTVGNVLMHLDAQGVLSGFSRTGVLLGLYTSLLMIIFMGGRVIPFFTESTLAKAQPRTWPAIEIASHVTAWAFLVTQLTFEKSALSAVVALAAAGVHLIRLGGWYVRRIRRVPLIAILHWAYLWIVVGFGLSGLASLGLILPSLAVHAFTVGALGTVIFGMITRVSLGHTGRPLRPTRTAVVAYGLLAIAALSRTLLPWAFPDTYHVALIVSGGLWISAFALFCFAYGPILTAPRTDQRDG